MAGFGSYTAFNSTGYLGGIGNAKEQRSVCRLTDTLSVVCFRDTWTSPDELIVRAATISGSVITFGTEQIIASYSDVNDFAVAALSDTHFVVVYQKFPGTGSGISDGYIRVGSVSGSTITLGSEVKYLDEGTLGINEFWGGIQVVALDSSKILIGNHAGRQVISPADPGYYLTVANISGTTVSSVGTNTLFRNTIVFHYLAMTTLTTTTVAIVEGRKWGTSANDSEIYASIATVSGSSVSIGSAATIYVGGLRPHSASTTALSGSNFVITFTDEYATFYGNLCSVSGSTITPGSNDVVDTYPAADHVFYHNTSKISSTKYIVGYNYRDNTLSVNYPTFKIVQDIAGTLTAIETQSFANAMPASQQNGTVVVIWQAADSYFMAFEDFVSPFEGRAVMYAPPPEAVKALGISLGRGAGAKLYVTAWSAAGSELVLMVYDVPAMTLSASYSLGAASLDQVNAKTYWAYPFTVAGSDDAVIVFGRMNDPANYGDPVHMMYSIDAGATFVLMENSMGDDHIGAVIDDWFGFIYAARNIDGNSPKVYTGLPGSTLSLLSTIPLNGGINPQALRFDFNGNLLAGVDVGRTEMIVYSVPPYISWVDFTFNHAPANGINSIIVL